MVPCGRLCLAVLLLFSGSACGGIYISGISDPQGPQRYLEKQQKSVDQQMQKHHEHFSLPEDYVRIISSPMIDRPVLVSKKTEEDSCKTNWKAKMSSSMQTEASRAQYHREFSEMERNKIIQRLFLAKIFRQILPHNDPNDPAIPPDALVLESTTCLEGISNIQTLSLRDNMVNKLVIIKGTFEDINGTVFTTGVSRFYMDSVLLDSINHVCKDTDCGDRINAWADSCLDKMLGKMVADYRR
jgi:hypothetical protein